MLDQVFSQCFSDWHVGTESEYVIWIICVNYWIVERMGDCTSA
jgi:hypothetical protein